MEHKVPILEQCHLSVARRGEYTVEKLSDYLARNRNMVFPHRHNFYHIVFFTQGGGQHTVDFESFDIVEGQVYFMCPGQMHTWSFVGDMEGYVVNFDADLFKTFLWQSSYLSQFSFFSGRVQDQVFVLEVSTLSAALALLDGLLESALRLDYARVLLLHMFHLLDQERSSQLLSEPLVYNHRLLRNFQALIEHNYKDLRLPKDYAALLYITPNHLNALCKELVGKSAGELIRDRVLLEAKRLLVVRSLTIREVAFALNFNDNSYFTKFFKKIEGLTPEEFRKEHV